MKATRLDYGEQDRSIPMAMFWIGLVILRYANHCRGVGAAWRVTIRFAITVICFFGVNLLSFSSLHPCGQLRPWRAG